MAGAGCPYPTSGDALLKSGRPPSCCTSLFPRRLCVSCHVIHPRGLVSPSLGWSSFSVSGRGPGTVMVLETPRHGEPDGRRCCRDAGARRAGTAGSASRARHAQPPQPVLLRECLLGVPLLSGKVQQRKTHPQRQVQFSSVTQSCLTLRPHEPQHARPPCPSPTPEVLHRLMFIELVMPSSHLILCRPFVLLPSRHRNSHLGRIQKIRLVDLSPKITAFWMHVTGSWQN